MRYLSATGRTAELDRLNSESHLPGHQSDLFDLFATHELRALDELHEQVATGTVELSLRAPERLPDRSSRHVDDNPAQPDFPPSPARPPG
ncbi:hypothetical protein [Rugosimonospora africana]|uniref:hypothetical protein n=1 Tax=Rugosimonospora africana TaxID=556532 RepID=UPI0019451F25|nr:hypothetical protein [Rugosimonospora africana]